MDKLGAIRQPASPSSIAETRRMVVDRTPPRLVGSRRADYLFAPDAPATAEDHARPLDAGLNPAMTDILHAFIDESSRVESL